MQIYKMKPRKCDAHGCGDYGASRGNRKHNGYDLSCMAGTAVSSPIRGMVSKLGYPYTDDLSYRYVEIEAAGYAFRLFYVDPVVEVGQQVQVGDIIGVCQGLMRRYPGITDHVHFEIKDTHGDHVDPTPVLIALGATL